MRTMVSLLASAAFVLGAHAGEADDPTIIQQIKQSRAAESDLITTEQLYIPADEAAAERDVDQLTGETGDIIDNTVIQQAEGGTDYCAPGTRHKYAFCEAQENMPIAARKARTSLPEEEFTVGSPESINRFTLDPALTADEIGRGQLSSDVAQSVASDVLGTHMTPLEDLSPTDLPPDALQDHGSAPPIIVQGN